MSNIPNSQKLALGWSSARFYQTLLGNTANVGIYQQTVYVFKFIGYQVGPCGTCVSCNSTATPSAKVTLAVDELACQLLNATLQIAKSQQVYGQARDEYSLQIVDFVSGSRKDPHLIAELRELSHGPLVLLYSLMTLQIVDFLFHILAAPTVSQGLSGGGKRISSGIDQASRTVWTQKA